jgi:hypothetical protein
VALLDELPRNVVELMRSAAIAEFATTSAAGVPIDTPVLIFPSDGLRSIDVATGLSYPAKAERARRNPKVGLLIEGGPDEPVISIAGLAAVRDADLQANVERYLSEAGHALAGDPDWSLSRGAVWYWTRIIIEVTPARVIWWDTSADMDEAPHRWEASPETTYPTSDPAPPGAPSRASDWRQPSWRSLADRAVTRGAPGHLTLIDAEGFPAPIRARKIRPTEEGFALEMPQAAPWQAPGKASLSFQGNETFVGEVAIRDGVTQMRVERALPVLPIAIDQQELLAPSPETYGQLMARLRHEAARRGLPIPTMPAERPPPTEGQRLRMARRRAAAAAGAKKGA